MSLWLSIQELLLSDNPVDLAQSLNDTVLGSKGDTEKSSKEVHFKFYGLKKTL